MQPAPAGAATVTGASPLPWSGDPGYSYLRRSTDQLGVPGSEAGAALTPEGGIFTGSVEAVPWLKGTRLGTLSRRGLPDPQVPLMATRPDARNAGAAWWATSIAGVPSAVMALAPGTRRSAGVALRWGGKRDPGVAPSAYRFARPVTPARPGLYSQPGEPFAPGRCWKVKRSGRVLEVRRGTSIVALVYGTRGTGTVLPGAGKPMRCSTSPSRFAVEIKARTRTSKSRIHVVVPLYPIAADDTRLPAILATDVRATGAALAASWKAQRAAASVVQLPEASVQKAFDASVTNLLIPRYQLADGTWVQAVNLLGYHAYWLRDAAMMSNALDLVGMHGPAADDLAFVRQWQNPDGEFASRLGQRDGFGQALWALGQHTRLTGDVAFAQSWLPAIDHALTWITNALATSPNGLLPPSDPHDNELLAGEVTGDQLWAVAGLDATVALANTAGDAKTASRARALREKLKASVVNAARASAVNGRIRPVLDQEGGYSWGELWAAWPYPTFAPDDPLVMSTMGASLAEEREGVSTYAGGQFLHLYTGFRVWQTLLRAGDQTTPLKGLYSTIAHLTATGGGFETNVRPLSDREATTNLTPHGWLAAELVTFVHDLLAREQDGDLVVLGTLPSSWLDAGKVTSVTNLPTNYGPITLRLEPSPTGAILSWSLQQRSGTVLKRIRFPLPASITAASVTGSASLDGRDVVLGGTSGSAGITWTRSADPGPTMAGTIAALQAEFKAAKQPMPR